MSPYYFQISHTTAVTNRETIVMESKPFYKAAGDIINGFVVLNTLAFAASVAFSDNFDPTWKEEGFCVSNKETPMWNSHALSFYVDTVTSAILAVVYFLYKSTVSKQVSEIIKMNIFGIFMHGLAHYGIAMKTGNAAEQVEYQQKGWIEAFEEDPVEFSTRLLGLFGFWFALLRATMPNANFKSTFTVATISCVVNTKVAPQFGFTFVQTVLMLSAALNQLKLPDKEKGYTYFCFSLIVALPVGFVGWLESLTCSNFLIKYGGHMLYDGGICLSTLIFTFISIGDSKKRHEMKKLD